MKIPIQLQMIFGKIRRFWLLVRYPLFIGVLIGLLVGMVIIITNQGRAERASTAESLRRQAEIQLLLEEIQKGTNETNNHLDCILEYFSRSSRSNLFLENIDKCRYERRTEPRSQAPQQDKPKTTARKSTPRPAPSPSSTPMTRRKPSPNTASVVKQVCSNIKSLLNLPAIRDLCK